MNSKRRILIALYLFLAVLTCLLSGLVYFHYDVNDKAHYVTSEACQQCHSVRYDSWKNQTLHPIMFQPVNNLDEIQGDFDIDTPVVTFKKKEIEFVIGNKWEQVYARMIDGEYYLFPAKWLITTQQWVPYKVDSWRETPLSTNCNGCHTTGFNSDTYEFSEYGIGCEACHGQASKHVKQQQRLAPDSVCALCHANDLPPEDNEIIVSVKNSVCGQCHSRGQQSRGSEHMQTSFNFPLNYKPGEELPADYQQSTKQNDSKGKNWWATGLSKNRHQEFADFSVSAHSKSLRNLKEKMTPDRGELTDECLECHSADYLFAEEGNKPTLETAQEGISCVVCHDPHGLDREFKSLHVSAERCGSCHLDSFSNKAAYTGRAHTPCPPSAATCADCHMPYIIKSGGAFPIRSHAFKIVPPVATEALNMPNSCQNGGCHTDRTLDWAKQAFDEHYPEFTGNE